MDKKNKSVFTYRIEDAITPLDGRNKYKLKKFNQYWSELILNKNRVLVEIAYLQELSKYQVIRNFTKEELAVINRLHKLFNRDDYQKIREIETLTNHDVKAVEEWLKNKLGQTTMKDLAGMIHFSLTAEDINNLAYGLMIKDLLQLVLLPELDKIKKILSDRAKIYQSIPMLSRTHGQPAAPTTVGKELLVYYQRLKGELDILKNWKIKGKLTGNVGNLNSHHFLFPNINWLEFGHDLVKSLGLDPDMVTTQIEPYDHLIAIFNSLSRINNILIGLCVDFWLYISFGYFRQKVIKSEVGSTALPHKVNPIYFEGAEGGLGIATSLLDFYSDKLSYSRLQRDLSDSIIRRSFGIAFAYSFLSYQSIVEAFGRIEPDQDKINEDLDKHWEVLSEPIQNFLRWKNYPDAYEKTKRFFRGKTVNKQDIKNFINNLKLDRIDRKKLLGLTPQNYTGYAEKLVSQL